MYIVVNYEQYNDGTKDSPAIYGKDTLDEAVSLFHQKMSSAMNNSKVSHVLCSVVGISDGITYRTETWTRPVTAAEEA